MRGRDNRRRGRTDHQEHQLLTRSALFGVAVVALGVSCSGLTRYATHHPYFTVQEVVVDDDAGFTQEEILAWSGLTPGISLWEIDPRQIETRLLAHSWIQTAQV